MLYEEFLRGTASRANEHNWEVYKGIEAMYNRIDAMTKEEAYSVALPYIDNQLTAQEQAMLDWVDDLLREKLDEMADLLDDMRHEDEEVKRLSALVSDELDAPDFLGLDAAAASLEFAAQMKLNTEHDLRSNEGERRMLERLRQGITSGRYC